MWTRYLFLFPLCVVGALLAAQAPEQTPAADDPKSLIGKQAPALKLPLLAGESLNSEDFLGKKFLVLDFWATWCPWCRNSTDKFVELSKKYADKEIGFYMVSVGEKREAVAAYFEKNPVEAQIALDSERAVSDQYLVDYIPHVVIIGKDGKVLDVAIGEDKVAAALEKTLEELFPKEGGQVSN